MKAIKKGPTLEIRGKKCISYKMLKNPGKEKWTVKQNLPTYLRKFLWTVEQNSVIREFPTICEPRIPPVSPPLRLLRERCHRERFRGLPLHLNVQARSASSFQARRFEGRVGGTSGRPKELATGSFCVLLVT